MKSYLKMEAIMSYLALYRKYRPQNFDHVVGQSETTEILKNQIRNSKFGHAYLFSGIRGTGKTSTAKILSKAINCLDPHDGNPCNKCEICLEINNESFMDVIEIDAASNNGVDNVRELRENSKYLPAKGSHKVYIIDEVQMLSPGAFNALLKTLEEPSKHVVFILATTEPEKIPVTILSRCQRYDFKRVRLDDMISRMKYILDDLSYSFDTEALNLIALKSDGAMRDALSLLEKVISKSNEHISVAMTTSVLGVIEFVELKKLFEAIFSQQVEMAIQTIDHMIVSGISISNIFEQILEFIRNIMLMNVFKTTNEIVALPEKMQEDLLDEFNKVDIKLMSEMIDIINQSIAKLKYAANPRLNLELSIISICLLFKEGEMVQEKYLAPQKKIEKEKVLAPVETAVEEKKVTAVEVSVTESVIEDNISREINNVDVLSNWNKVLEIIKQRRKIVHAFLVEGNPVKVEQNIVFIEFQPEYDFHRGNVMLVDNRDVIEKALLEFTGKRYQIEAVLPMKKVVEEKTNLDKIKDFLGDEFKEILEVE